MILLRARSPSSIPSRKMALPQKLPLYFLELTNPTALITCYIDGQEVKPEGRILTFPSLGTHALSITVQESEDKIWDLEYQVKLSSSPTE